MEISDLAGFGNVFEKIVSLIKDLASPKLKKMHADANCYEMEQILSVFNKQKCFNGELEYQSENFKIKSNFKEEVNKLEEENIKKIVKETYLNLVSFHEAGLKISSQLPDPEWLSRFFKAAEEISTDTVRQLWAKILAGEIRSPKSFSLRTLEALRNLSKEESSCFCRFANFTIEDRENKKRYFLKSAEKLVAFEDLILLKDIGLISDSLYVGFVLNLNLEDKAGTLVCGDRALVFILDDNSGSSEIKIPLNVMMLPEVSRQLCELADIKCDDDFIEMVANQFRIAGVKIYSGPYSDDLENNPSEDLLIEKKFSLI